MDIAEDFRARLMSALERRGWTADDLAEAAGVPRSTAYSWISDERPRLPHAKTREFLYGFLDMKAGPPDLDTNIVPKVLPLAPEAEDSLQLSKIPDEKRADAVEFEVLNQIPIDYTGARLLLEIRARRYGRFSVNDDAQGLFIVRIPADLGRYKGGDCLTVNSNLSPLPGEKVCVRARGKRWIGEYDLVDGGKPVVTLWGTGGGPTEAFELIGTVTDRSNSELQRPR